MHHEPRRHWWRRKRWIAALLLTIALAYPLSFVPAFWVATRLDHGSAEFQFLCRFYRPMAIVLIESPHAFRNCIYWAVERGTPEGVTFARNYDHGVMWRGPGDSPGSYYTYTLLWYR